MRVKAPLLTLMAGGNPEVEYCILKHLEAVVHRVCMYPTQSLSPSVSMLPANMSDGG